MRNHPHRPVGEEERGATRWMLTFSDMSTLLLTFFVMLLSMSTMDSKTIENMFHNFTASSGVLRFEEYSEISRPKEVLIRGLYERLKDALIVRKVDENARETEANQGETPLEKAGTAVIFENFQNGFKIVFGQQLVFEPGRAEVKEEMKPVLNKIAGFMRRSSYQVYIDGHTDSVPIRKGEFASNEELSVARAYNLMDHLVTAEKVSPHSIALAGYGEMHPLAPNDTPEGRSKNRRVEIIFKNQKYF